MGFNFGAFLGGMAQGAADSITAKEEELSRIRLMDAEAATRERLAKNAERIDRNTIIKAVFVSDIFFIECFYIFES